MRKTEKRMAPPFETLTGEPLSPGERTKLIEEISTRRIQLGGTRVSVMNVRDNRRLLAAVSETINRVEMEGPLDALSPPISIDRWPEVFEPIEKIVRTYVPTAFLLERVDWEDQARVMIDEDWGRSPDYVSAFTLATRRENPERIRVKTTLVKGCVQPLCITAESSERKKLMQLHGRGIPLPGNEGYVEGRLWEKLLMEEILAGIEIPPDGQLALMMVLAADTGVVAFFSEEGDWPGNSLVVNVAERLGVRIIRFNFQGVPQEVRRRFSFVVYDEYERVLGG